MKLTKWLNFREKTGALSIYWKLLDAGQQQSETEKILDVLVKGKDMWVSTAQKIKCCGICSETLMLILRQLEARLRSNPEEKLRIIALQEYIVSSRLDMEYLWKKGCMGTLAKMHISCNVQEIVWTEATRLYFHDMMGKEALKTLECIIAEDSPVASKDFTLLTGE